MSRHIPLYRALLELLRALSVRTSLAHLLLPFDADDEASSSVGVAELLEKMKQCVDTYASRLKSVSFLTVTPSGLKLRFEIF